MEGFTIATSFAGAFALGTIFAVLGAVKLNLARILDVDDAQYGRLISALMFTSMIAVLVIAPLQAALGFFPIAVVAFVASGACLWLLATVKSYKVALVAAALLGIAGMCASVTGSVLGIEVLFDGENEPAAQNVINVFFGLGAFLTPYIVGKLMNNLGYQKTVSIIGAIVFVPIILVFFSTFPETAPFDIGEFLGLLATPYALFGGLALFCYVGLEASMGGFVSTYLKDHELTDEQANKWLGGFWVALILGRILAFLVLGLVLEIEGAAQGPVAPVLGILAVVTISLMVIAKTAKAGIIGTLLTGLIFGPIFPMVVGVTQAKSGEGIIFSWIFAIGLLGATILPALIGKLSAASTIRQSMKAAVVVALVLVVFSTILWFVPAAG